MTAIEVKNLTKKFRHFTAVKNLNFRVAENLVTGFLGPNGAGKTTTIRMLVGLSNPSSGEIKIADTPLRFGDSRPNSLFGYLPEQPSFYAWMSGVEYMQFAAEAFGMAKDIRAKKIKKLLDLVDLGAASRKRIGTYSNGMRQRLGIAQALVNDPKVLIMDEPVSALDPIGRREVLTIIEELKKSMTIFLSTHILSDVDRICDNVIIIKEGEIIADASLSSLKENYAKPLLSVEFCSDPIRIIADLKKEAWVRKIEKTGNHLKIWPNDQDVVQTNIPLKFLLQQKIGILQYGLVLPETEDLFVDLIKEVK